MGDVNAGSNVEYVQEELANLEGIEGFGDVLARFRVPVDEMSVCALFTLV